MQVRAGQFLEGVAHDSATIEDYFCSNPQDEEEAIQACLIKWKNGRGFHPPTWEVLLDAMQYAEIAQHHMNNLNAQLTT